MTTKPELTTSRLLLRMPRPTDVDALYAVMQESLVELCQWMPWCHPNYQRKDSVDWINSCPGQWESGDAYGLLIFDRESHELVGGCGLNAIDKDRRRANLGYWVRSSRTGQGIATSAARRLAVWALEDLKMMRLEIVAGLGNTGSQRVAEKVGAVREGVLRNRVRVGDRWHDAVMYSLVPDDLQRLREVH